MTLPFSGSVCLTAPTRKRSLRWCLGVVDDISYTVVRANRTRLSRRRGDVIAAAVARRGISRGRLRRQKCGPSANSWEWTTCDGYLRWKRDDGLLHCRGSDLQRSWLLPQVVAQVIVAWNNRCNRLVGYSFRIFQIKRLYFYVRYNFTKNNI